MLFFKENIILALVNFIPWVVVLSSYLGVLVSG